MTYEPACPLTLYNSSITEEIWINDPCTSASVPREACRGQGAVDSILEIGPRVWSDTVLGEGRELAERRGRLREGGGDAALPFGWFRAVGYQDCSSSH